MIYRCFFCLALLGLILTVMVGCGSGSKVVPVSGTVTVDGQPANDCIVNFQPKSTGGESPGPGASGKTDAEGHFVMKTVEGDNSREGATPGTNKVTIFWLDPANFDQEEGAAAPQPTAAPFKLPKSAGDGSMTFDVPADGTDSANFDL